MPSLAERLGAVVAALPDDAAVTLPVSTLRLWLADAPAGPSKAAAVPEPQTWREKLWTCPADTRLGVRELAEAMGRARTGEPDESASSTKRKRVRGSDWIYRAVDRKRAAAHGRDALPCARLDGVLVFTVGAVRRWLQASEATVNPEPASNRPSLRVSRHA